MEVQAAVAIASVNPVPQMVDQTSFTHISSRPLLGLSPSLSLKAPLTQGRAVRKTERETQRGRGRRREGRKRRRIMPNPQAKA